MQTLQRYFSRLPPLLLNGLKFQAPFSDLLEEAGVKDRFLKKWLDYLCFVLQALPAAGHPSAPVAYMVSDMYSSGAVLDYPKGGMGALIDALVQGLEKHRGQLRYNAHVDQILVEDGQACGVSVKGQQIRAREAVVSNASVWDTEHLLPEGSNWKSKPPECGSFMHLHLGLKAEALPSEMPLHYSVIRDWEEPIDATGNVVIISVPSVVNPALAPEGRHCLHAYLAATEPFELWKGMDRRSPEYAKLKRQRAQPLFEAVERAVPGGCENIEMELIGSPLTHARFNRRHAGSYGPFTPAEAGMLPGASTPIDGLLHCGDSTFPGIGVPAAVASGFSAANVLLSVEEHLETLDAMKIP